MHLIPVLMPLEIAPVVFEDSASPAAAAPYEQTRSELKTLYKSS